MRDDPGYTEDQWAGHACYRCKGCRFSTLNKAEMDKHVQNIHLFPEEIMAGVPEAAIGKLKETETKRQAESLAPDDQAKSEKE